MSINFRRDRTTALTSIEKLLVFVKDLNNKYPDIGFGNTLSEILKVKEILSHTTDRCLTDSQIDAFRRFGDMLTMENGCKRDKRFNLTCKIQNQQYEFSNIF